MTMQDQFVILYASQTGNSEWIAKSIHQQAQERGFKCHCYVMDDWAKVFPSLFNTRTRLSYSWDV